MNLRYLSCCTWLLLACEGSTAPSLDGGRAAQGGAGGSSAGAELSRVYLLDTKAEQVTYADVDPTSGVLSMRGSLAVESATIAAVLSADEKRLYAVTQQSLSGISLDPTAGTQASLGRLALTGHDPTHLWLHPAGRWLVVGQRANVFEADVSPELEVFAAAADGRLQGQPARVSGSSAVARIVADPSARHVYGLTCDSPTLSQYSFDSVTGELAVLGAAAALPSAGDLAFHPSGAWAYTTHDERISQLRYDAASGRLETVAETPYHLPSEQDLVGSYCLFSRVISHPSGRFILVALNEGGGTIYTFAVAPQTGALTRLARFQYSRFRTISVFAADLSGRFLFAGGGSNVVHTFAIDPQTGTLTFLRDVPGPSSGANLIAIVER